MLSTLHSTFPTASLDKRLRRCTPSWYEPKLLLSDCHLLPYPCFYYPLPQFHSVVHQLDPPVVSTFLDVSFTFVLLYLFTLDYSYLLNILALFVSLLCYFKHLIFPPPLFPVFCTVPHMPCFLPFLLLS